MSIGAEKKEGIWQRKWPVLGERQTGRGIKNMAVGLTLADDEVTVLVMDKKGRYV